VRTRRGKVSAEAGAPLTFSFSLLPCAAHRAAAAAAAKHNKVKGRKLN